MTLTKKYLLPTIAIVFGLLTILSGGKVIFGASIYQEMAGNYVPFVLWFNFLAGFAYVAAGIALLKQKSCGIWLSLAIASLTLIVFALLGFHIVSGHAYEMRTVMAMILRSGVWASIFALSYKKRTPFNPENSL